MAGLSNLAFAGLDLFSHTAEAEEGARAFAERRPPDFSPYR
jgi:1,4-dihydroxy-2-naphthoyl-CoA synthase